jgi:hypothetical protein
MTEPTQPTLFVAPQPPAPPSWCDLRLGDIGAGLEDLARAGERFDVVFADPPWKYDDRASASSAASDEYSCLDLHQISAHLAGAFSLANRGARLALWMTWAQLPDFVAADDFGGWTWVTGGMWAKADPAVDDQRSGALGMGYHMRTSQSELLLVCKGRGPHARADVTGCWIAPGSGRHSEKPVGWQRDMIREWCPPGGHVLDLYAGLGSVARAVREAGGGRTYVGYEIDPERHASALSLLAMTQRDNP